MSIATPTRPPLDFTADREASAEWRLRVDLAAAHRQSVKDGFSEGIYNHLTAAVPDAPGRFLVPPFGLHWSEVTASALLTVDAQGQVVGGSGQLQRSAYCIHSPIHLASPKHAVVLHTHAPFSGALTRLEEPELLPVGQTEVLLLDHIAYDHHYDGLARDLAEGERLARVLGDKTILFMANHGVVVTGATVAEAYDRLYSLERACRVQLYALWTGKKLRTLSPEQVKKAQDQFNFTPLHDASATQYKPGYELHFDAIKRLLDREQPDYRH